MKKYILVVTLLLIIGCAKQEPAAPQEPTTPDTDFSILDAALRNSDESACNQITRQDIKDDCINAITSKTAASSLSTSACNKIPDQETKSSSLIMST